MMEGIFRATDAPDTASFTVRMRTDMAIPHLLSAARHARSARDVEAAYGAHDFGDFWEDIRSEAIATVLSAAASIESYSNELFADRERVFPRQSPELLAALWPVYERLPVLEKLDFALALRDEKPLDAGRSPRQEAPLLIGLRNAITHFKPEWDDEAKEHAKLSTKLGGVLRPSPWLAGERLFPRAWASASTCRWAVVTAHGLLLHFEERAGLASKFTDFEVRLRV